jgi:hypothetical protein
VCKAGRFRFLLQYGGVIQTRQIERYKLLVFLLHCIELVVWEGADVLVELERTQNGHGPDCLRVSVLWVFRVLVVVLCYAELS